jgi:hypothetical protein
MRLSGIAVSITASFCLLLASQAKAELQLADIFTDGAVLQRDQEIPIWGTDTPGAEASVSFIGHSVSTKVDDKGRWQARLPALKASREPKTLTVASSFADSTGIQLKDILIGEVWLCSGQSNMAMPVARAENADASLLHPPNKQDFAHRLALWARAEVYGENVPWSGPQPTAHRIAGDKVHIDFSHSEKKMVARDAETLQGFQLRAANGTWHTAEATIDGDTITVTADGIKSPIAVRYAWENHPKVANLFNSAGLPATPFQLGDTDKAPGENSTAAAAPTTKKSTTPPPTDPPLTPVDISTLPGGSDQLDIFLLMGQSNMKGRGVMPAKAATDPQIVMMHKKTDEWFVARHPLHLVGDPKTFKGHDNAGVGPGLAFAETIRRHRPSTRVALVPCAVGGSRIALWKKGARLYEDTVRRAKLALKAGPEGKTRIAAALWLQGESDANEERLPIYADALAGMITDLRTDLGNEDLPFLVTTIGELRDDIELRKKINLILVDLPNQVPDTAVADARDLDGHIGDRVHYDTATQNEIGRRFGRAWLKLPAAKKP